MRFAAIFAIFCVSSALLCLADFEAFDSPEISQYYKDLAKHINSREDVLWVANDPDMTEEEYEARTMVIQQRIELASAKGDSKHLGYDFLSAKAKLPEELLDPTVQASTPDWYLTNRNSLRPVGDQGQCGSCWAFSTVHTLNDVKNIQTGDMTPMSIQEVLTCCKGEGCGGCDGGYLQSSYNYMANYGTPPDSCKPYNQYPGRCTTTCNNGQSAGSQKHYGPKSYTPVFTPGTQSIMNALAKGPASGSLMVYDDLMTYRSGIYHHTRGSLQGGHAIEIVGYALGSTPYWRVKNSWDPSFGENGYFRIALGTNECQFESMERGYAGGVVTSSVGKPNKIEVQSSSSSDYSYDLPTNDPATDGPIVAPDIDPVVWEAAQYAASQLNPVFCAGNVTVDEVLQAEKQVVSGTKFFLVLSVAAPSCERGPELYFAQVYWNISGQYTMQSEYSLGPTASSYYVAVGGSDSGTSTWMIVGSVFIVLAVVLLLVTICLAVRCKKTGGPASGDEQTTQYRNLNDQL